MSRLAEIPVSATEADIEDEDVKCRYAICHHRDSSAANDAAGSFAADVGSRRSELAGGA